MLKTTMNNYSTVWFQEKTGYPRNILEFDLDTDKYHPTQKSTKLLEYLIKTYTQEDDVILDNCIGSGTTAIATLNVNKEVGSNRKYIGMELEEEYVDIANDRIEQHKLILNKQIAT